MGSCTRSCVEPIADMCSVWGGGRYSVRRLEKVLRRLGEAEKAEGCWGKLRRLRRLREAVEGGKAEETGGG